MCMYINCICGRNTSTWRAVARRASEHVEVTNVLSRNPKADYFEDRVAIFSATKDIVTCKGVRITYKRGSGLDDWICWQFIDTARDYRQLQSYRHIQNSTYFLTATNSNSSSTEISQLLISKSNDLLCTFIPPRHGPCRKHSILWFWRLFTDPLLSNGSIRHIH
jgi:hypothetical protein